VSFTLVPEAKEALHVGLQAMPAGVLVTVPVEVPASVTVSWNVVAGATSGCWAIEVVTKAVVRMAARMRIRWQFNRLDLQGRDRGLRFDGGRRWAVGRENRVVSRFVAGPPGFAPSAALRVGSGGTAEGGRSPHGHKSPLRELYEALKKRAASGGNVSFSEKGRP
jgi:hypothetical protein